MYAVLKRFVQTALAGTSTSHTASHIFILAAVCNRSLTSLMICKPNDNTSLSRIFEKCATKIESCERCGKEGREYGILDGDVSKSLLPFYFRKREKLNFFALNFHKICFTQRRKSRNFSRNINIVKSDLNTSCLSFNPKLKRHFLKF